MTLAGSRLFAGPGSRFVYAAVIAKTAIAPRSPPVAGGIDRITRETASRCRRGSCAELVAAGGVEDMVGRSVFLNKSGRGLPRIDYD